jgi:hypothetical protein
MKTYYQQGDVLIIPITDLPKELEEIKGATLALGEHTGHHHTLFDDEMDYNPKSTNPYNMGSKKVKLFQDKQKITYMKVDNVVFLKHQEHKAFKIDPGVYKIGIVKEFDPFEQMKRNVID